MFNPKRVLIDAFVVHVQQAYRSAFPTLDPALEAALESATRTALAALRHCDCPYHDVEHTLLVTDAGLAILAGRMVSRGDVSAHVWLQAVVAMLFHDLGYRRGLLRDDADGTYVADAAGERVPLPPESTDASMTPYHVTRGSLFVQERFANDPMIDAPLVASYIEMTRFPVPEAAEYQPIDSIAALVRAADLIGQMGDPGYATKQVRLFAEMAETGEARRLGYDTAAQLRAGFQGFFYRQVYPYLTAALGYLSNTPTGQRWIASLFDQVHPGRRDRGTARYRANLAEFVAGLAWAEHAEPHLQIAAGTR